MPSIQKIINDFNTLRYAGFAANPVYKDLMGFTNLGKVDSNNKYDLKSEINFQDKIRE